MAYLLRTLQASCHKLAISGTLITYSKLDCGLELGGTLVESHAGGQSQAGDFRTLSTVNKLNCDLDLGGVPAGGLAEELFPVYRIAAAAQLPQLAHHPCLPSLHPPSTHSEQAGPCNMGNRPSRKGNRPSRKGNGPPRKGNNHPGRATDHTGKAIRHTGKLRCH